MQAQLVQQNPPQMQPVGASQQDTSPQVSQQVIPFTTEDSQEMFVLLKKQLLGCLCVQTLCLNYCHNFVGVCTHLPAYS